MSELLGVVGMTFKFVNPSHSGNVTVTGSPSTKVKAGSQFVYQDNLSILISNGSDGNITNATGTGIMQATSTKLKVESKKPLRKKDKSNIITMTGTNPSPPPPTLTYTTQVEIDNAGQDKTKGE